MRQNTDPYIWWKKSAKHNKPKKVSPAIPKGLVRLRKA